MEVDFLKDLKRVLFEIYSAGFEAGYSQKVDIVSAYNQYWDIISKQIIEEIGI